MRRRSRSQVSSPTRSSWRRGRWPEVDAEVVETTTDSVSAVMGTGVGGLNPAVVTVRHRKEADGRAILQVRGVAKEGLVKQRGGQRAAEGLADRLRQLLAGAGEGPGTGQGQR